MPESAMEECQWLCWREEDERTDAERAGFWRADLAMSPSRSTPYFPRSAPRARRIAAGERERARMVLRRIATRKRKRSDQTSGVQTVRRSYRVEAIWMSASSSSCDVETRSAAGRRATSDESCEVCPASQVAFVRRASCCAAPRVERAGERSEAR